jgi:hypothetical protein
MKMDSSYVCDLCFSKNSFEINTASFTENIKCGFPYVFLCLWIPFIGIFYSIGAVFRECVYTKFAVSIWKEACYWFAPICCS